uniref:Uncharacterized protein n=1 Tax=Rodentolepis nana TaxID=102285 RepID=A0A0R3TE47_RODNA
MSARTSTRAHESRRRTGDTRTKHVIPPPSPLPHAISSSRSSASQPVLLVVSSGSLSASVSPLLLPSSAHVPPLSP